MTNDCSPRWLSIACALTLPSGAHAAYPETPVRMILPHEAGAATDIVARIVGSKLGDVPGQQFIIDNRPGAAAIIAVETVARATPNGYTLLQCGVSQAISPALKRKLPYDPANDFVRVSQLLVPVAPTLPWPQREAP